jgi:Flp pilus assembly protein protease CpaA
MNMDMQWLTFLWTVFADALFVICLAWVSICDLTRRIIPNRIILVLAVLGLLNLAVQIIIDQIWWMYPAGILAGLPFFAAWLKGKIGAGDVKLIAVCGLYLGLISSLAGMLVLLIILAAVGLSLWIKTRSLRYKLPLGPMIALAFAIAATGRYWAELLCWRMV